MPPASIDNGAGPYLAFWRALSHPLTGVGIVTAPTYWRQSVWPRVFAATAGAAAHLALTAPGESRLFISADPPPLPGAKPPLGITRSVAAHGSIWRLDVWPSRPEAVEIGLERRQWLYVGTLVLILATLIFGIYISARTLQKQLEVARLKSEFVSAASATASMAENRCLSPLIGV